MAKPCGTCGKSSASPGFRTSSSGIAAVAAASEVHHEVLSASGAPVGRSFTSLLAAQDYAKRIGGSTRPKA